MTDLDSPAARAELEAPVLRVWIGDLTTGAWCPTCLLPSACWAPVGCDLAVDPGWLWLCLEDKTHRPVPGWDPKTDGVAP